LRALCKCFGRRYYGLTYEQWQKPQGFRTRPGSDAHRYGRTGKRDNVLVAASWLHKAPQEEYLLYESCRSDLRRGLLGVISANNHSELASGHAQKLLIRLIVFALTP